MTKLDGKRIEWCTCDEVCPIHGDPEAGGRTLTVAPRPEYGKDLYMPVCELSHRFLALLKLQKTFTRGDLERIKALGFNIRTKGELL